MNGGFSPAQAIIAAMITPALLILASSSLIATALVRLARVVDHVRRLTESSTASEISEDFERHERRAMLAERAVLLYFLAVVLFVTGGFAIALDHAADGRLWWVPVLVTAIGMALLVGGSAAMLTECRLAIAQIRMEISAARRK